MTPPLCLSVVGAATACCLRLRTCIPMHRCRWRWASGRRSACLATTTTRPTAPACGTTCEQRLRRFPAALLVPVGTVAPAVVGGVRSQRPSPACQRLCAAACSHVVDLAAGHVSALKNIESRAQPFCDPINLGTGRGTSVLEMVKVGPQSSAAMGVATAPRHAWSTCRMWMGQQLPPSDVPITLSRKPT
jgi:hypothetical protein